MQKEIARDVLSSPATIQSTRTLLRGLLGIGYPPSE